jgi:tRNA-guanine family transglycosylase
LEAILVNAPDVLKNFNKYQQLIQVAGPRYTMLDSGGYQLYLQENKTGVRITFDEEEDFCMSPTRFNISPRHVVDVAARINPDIVVALDYPVRKLTGDSEQRAEFYKKLPFNMRWALRTSELMIQRGLDTNTLFIPVQCYDTRQFRIFYSCIQGCEFGGFSMPVRNLKLDKILEFLLRMHGWGVFRAHLLGTTSAKTLALSAFMARHLFDWVSLDSATYRLTAGYGQYLASEDLRIINVGHKDPVARTTPITCRCNWCRYYRTFGDIIDLERSHKSSFLYRHNLVTTFAFARNAYANAASAASLVQFISNNFKNRSIANETINAVREAEQVLFSGSSTATGSSSQLVVV